MIKAELLELIEMMDEGSSVILRVGFKEVHLENVVQDEEGNIILSD